MAIAVSAAMMALTSVSSHGLVLEEIIVTAQKRVENLMDVPISLSAMSGDSIQDAGMQNLEDVSGAIPNFIVRSGAKSESISIRGISSGAIASIEQSVGTFVDGVYRGRGVQSRFSFLDVGMVEVLRGPQGALFGKNTIAGALNITSAKPTEEFEAQITALYEPGHDEKIMKGYVSGTLTDTFRARLALESTALDDGWEQNTYPGYSNDPTKDELAGRLSLEWDASDDLLVKFKYEKGDWDNTFGYDQTALGASFAAVPGLSGLPVDVGLGNSRATIGNNEPGIDYGSATVFSGDSEEIMLRAEYSVSSGTFTAIVAQSTYSYTRLIDADFTALDGIGYEEYEEFEQNSFELRFASELGNGFEYLAGVYYQDHELDNKTVTEANLRLDDPDSFGALAVGSLMQRGLPQAVAVSLVAAENQFARVNYIAQEGDSWAAFAQGTWELSDTVNTTIGVRYSEEEKTAEQGSHCAEFDTFTPNPDACTALAYGLFEFDNHILDLEREEQHVTYSANVSWDITDEVMLYATHSKGVKGGGFNSFTLFNDPDKAEFEDEVALSYELGAKMSLLDGAAELNAAIFDTKYTDQQAAIFTGATSFTVENASGADVSGIELDGRWQLTESLLLRSSAAKLNFEYTEYLGAACTDAQTTAFTGSGLCTQDLSGGVATLAPEYTFSLGLEHEIEVVNGLMLRTVAGVDWTDSYFLSPDLDELDAQDSYALVNLSIALTDEENGWSVALIGRNITDETYLTYSNDTPLLSGTHHGSTGRPASYALRGTLSF